MVETPCHVCTDFLRGSAVAASVLESPPDFTDLLQPEIASLPRREATARLLSLAAAGDD